MQINERELGRAIVHALFGIVFILAIMLGFLKVWMLAAIIIIGITASLISRQAKIPVIGFLLDRFERHDAILPGKNFILFLIGILLSFVLFPKDICLASIAILAFLDPVSHIMGIKFGRTKTFFNKEKNIEGPIAGVLVGSLGAMLFVNPLIALFGGFFGAFFELLNIQVRGIKVDDDLIIPLMAGLAMAFASFLNI